MSARTSYPRFVRRRRFLRLVLSTGAAAGLAGCVGDPDPDTGGDDDDATGGPDAAPGVPDASGTAPGIDAAPGCDAGVVMMYDTYAQALYMDGTYGPLTGVITVEYVLAGIEITLDFWHGHGGQVHTFTLLPEHFEMLKRGERVDLATTEVDSHHHTLFIDPADPEYRVEGSPPVPVPLGC